jgi:RNA polymerase sigma-70 factor (ECF subfamily)
MEAFGLLYERYERLVYRYVFHMLGDPDDADDAKQETFLKAYRSLGSFRGECSVATWLLKIAGNLCRDRIKKRIRRGEVELLPDIDVGSRSPGLLGEDPAAIVERRDLNDMVARVLVGLPAHQRELIVLRDVQQLSYQQIADVLGCSVASVKLRLFRARRGFKDRVESLLKVR